MSPKEFDEPRQALATALLDLAVTGPPSDVVAPPMQVAFTLADKLLAQMEQDGWRLMKPTFSYFDLKKCQAGVPGRRPPPRRSLSIFGQVPTIRPGSRS